MMLHVAHAAQHGHQRIVLRTVDTDVVVLAVMVSQTLPADTEVWLAFGTGKFSILSSPQNVFLFRT